MNYRSQLALSVLVLWCAWVRASADSTGHVRPDPEVMKRAFTRDCDTGYSLKCLKLDAVSFIEKMAETEEYGLLPGVSVVKETNANESKTAEIVAEMARSFPNDPDKRLDGYLMSKLSSYLSSHTLRLRLLDSSTAEEARDLVTGRGKGGGGIGGGGGKKGGMGGIIAAAMMMKGTLMSVGMGALALLAGKALMTAMMALMLSAIIGLKALSHGGEKKTTYEIVAKPVYSHSHSHSSSHEDVGHGGGHSGYGGYGRSLNFALPEHLKN